MKSLFELLTKKIVFEEAVEFFGDKIPMNAATFYEVAEEYKLFAFTVSGYTKAQIIEKFHRELLKAIEDGLTVSQFKESINSFLDEKGYKGVSNFQADVIFRTNIQTAYNVGHYKQMTNPEVIRRRPYWQYDAVNDKNTRPSHLAMDGKVFRADDPIWDIWYPPNGFRCRCGVNTLSERQVKERGLKIEEKSPTAAEVDGKFVNILPDPNFANNPAKNYYSPDFKNYPESIKKAFKNREKSK